MNATVVVVGGGYGGTAVAKALDDVADVVLVEPRDTFVHNVAALRAVVQPGWAGQLFFPYDRLLSRGRVVRDRAVRVDSAAVTLGSGERITADYTVLATGSGYPFPAKVDVDDRATAEARLEATREALAGARRALLLGAGPVGLELAGEVTAARPDTAVTIVDPSADILAGRFSDAFRAELRRQLDGLGVELLLGTSLAEDPPSDVGEAKTFTVSTRSGREVTADIWFRCFGVAPTTDYLAGDLAPARTADGDVQVTGDLRLPGQRHVFALGDITATPEAKMAATAAEHAEVVAANIRALMRGDERLTVHEPGDPAIALPLGPTGGASFSWEYAPETGVLDAEVTSQLKGADLMVDRFTEFFNLR